MSAPSEVELAVNEAAALWERMIEALNGLNFEQRDEARSMMARDGWDKALVDMLWDDLDRYDPGDEL